MPSNTSRTKPSAAPLTLGNENEDVVLVLQGGGALGAYQAGVYEVLASTGSSPSWVAGISIGAINSALIAGNPPERRVERMRAFWEEVSSSVPTPWMLSRTSLAREAVNEVSAWHVMMLGVPGFFAPRMPPAPLQPRGTMEAISFYDTTPLKETLEQLVDFDLLNDGPIRLSVGAVNVRTGNFVYFDNTQERIDARHIMASGALPPGFAPVEIDGEFYWDGGIVSNTPLQPVLDQPSGGRKVVFQIDLFSARGDLPATMPEVSEREKDIRFSSRTRQTTDNELHRRVVSQAARRLAAKLPPEWKDDPDLQLLMHGQCSAAVDIVHLIYRSKHYETQAKDAEFSRLSMLEHWEAGRQDTLTTLSDPRWTGRTEHPGGVRVFDLATPSKSNVKTRS